MSIDPVAAEKMPVEAVEPRQDRAGCHGHSEPVADSAVPGMAHQHTVRPGPICDGRGRVKRPDGTTIDGLYAAGGTTGGLEGGGALGYVGGLIKACVWRATSGLLHPAVG